MGVVEFDVLSDTVVATHAPLAGRGADPFASPKGDYVLLLGNTGTSLTMLKPGANGEASVSCGAIDLGFGVGGTHKAPSDVAFIEDATHNIAVITSTMDNYVVLADFSQARDGCAGAAHSGSRAPHSSAACASCLMHPCVSPAPSQVVDACDVHLVTTTTLELSNATDSTSNHGKGATRAIAWAVGSNYVWINSNGVDEARRHVEEEPHAPAT